MVSITKKIQGLKGRKKHLTSDDKYKVTMTTTMNVDVNDKINYAPKRKTK